MFVHLLLSGLLWGLAFGLAETAFFARANHVLPVGTGHLLLALLTTLLFAVLYWGAAAAAALLRRGRGRRDHAAIALAGPGLLLLILAISLYRDRIDPRPNDLHGLLGTVAAALIALAVVAVPGRLLRGRERALHRLVVAAGCVLAAAGGVWLATTRPAVPFAPAGGEAAAPAPAPGYLAGGPDDTGLRVLMIGLDGGTWKVIDPLMKAGRLPHFAEVCARGATADLEVVTPTYSPPLWTTIASGRTMDEHGIHDHIATALPLGLPKAPHQAKYLDNLTKVTRLGLRLWQKAHPFPPVWMQSGDVHVRRLWDVLRERDYPCVVVDWYVTYPAPPGPGITVSDQLYLHKADALDMPGLVWPDSLVGPFSRLVTTPEELDDDRVFAMLDTEGLPRERRGELEKAYPEWFRVIRKEMARDLTTAAIAPEALRRVPDWRFAGIYFRAMDNIHHMTWHLMDLPDTDLDAHPLRRFRTAVARYYEYCDRLLGEMLAAADERTVVVVLSDHGWENAEYAHFRAPDGFLIVLGGPARRGAPRTRVHIYDVAPTVLALLGLPRAEDMPGRVATELCEPGFWDAHPVRTIPTYETSPLHAESGGEVEIDRRTIEHLRALGY